MIEYKLGNIFQSEAQTLTSPVNVVGVAGKGLAAQFRVRYGLAHDHYVQMCEAYGRYLLGRPFVFRERGWDKQILFFPTKLHWRDPSRIEWIDDGLRYLAANYKWLGITSLALPALGSGLGQLDYAEVHERITTLLAPVDIHVQVYLPHEEDAYDLYHGQLARV